LPAIIQIAHTKIIDARYMNQRSFYKTIETNKVTFYSRAKNRLMTNGEESGNFFESGG